MRNLRSRNSCLQEGCNDSLEESEAEPQNIFLIQQTSSPLPCTSPVPPVSPNLSSIISSISTRAPCIPKSDVSINSKILKHEVNKHLKRYQTKKSAVICLLKKAIYKLKKEKDQYRKRLQRLDQTLKISYKTKMISRQNVPKKKPSPQAKMIRNLVKNFYEDDGNTRLSPGKQDCITRNGLKKQKRYLLDSLKNLHRKYLESESPPISYVTFTRLKPFWIIQPKVGSRETCLCKPHANMDLLIFSLKKNKIISENSTTNDLNSLTCKMLRLNACSVNARNAKINGFCTMNLIIPIVFLITHGIKIQKPT